MNDATEYPVLDEQGRLIYPVKPHDKMPEGATVWLGVTTTALTDGSTTNPITIGGSSVTAKVGGMCGYQGQEFVFDGTQWQALGKTELPAVTASDNGKRLGVSDGRWAVVNKELPTVDSNENGKILSASSGQWIKGYNDLVVNITRSGNSWSCDQFAGAIYQAYTPRTGARIYASIPGSDVSTDPVLSASNLLLPLTGFSTAHDRAIFSGVYYRGSALLVVHAEIYLLAAYVWTKTIQLSFDSDTDTLSISEV